MPNPEDAAEDSACAVVVKHQEGCGVRKDVYERRMRRKTLKGEPQERDRNETSPKALGEEESVERVRNPEDERTGYGGTYRVSSFTKMCKR